MPPSPFPTVQLHAIFPFNLQTEKGSALHEAALFGKTDVVQILLAAGERMILFWSNNMVIPSPRTWGSTFIVAACFSNQLSKVLGESYRRGYILVFGFRSASRAFLAPPPAMITNVRSDLMKDMNLHIVRKYSCFCLLYTYCHRYWCEHKG